MELPASRFCRNVDSNSTRCGLPKRKILNLNMGVVQRVGVSMSKGKYGLTHFLRIPLATAKSTPQLLASIDRIATDPITSAFPPAAWSSPDQIYLSIGCLSLKTPARVAAAVELLRRLDIPAIIDSTATTQDVSSTIVGDAHKYLYTASSSAKVTEKPDPAQAPAVTLRGLSIPPRALDYPRKTKELLCHIVESRPFLRHFCAIASTLFENQGFIPFVPPPGLQPLHVRLLTGKYLRTDRVNDKFTLEGKDVWRKPSFDVSDLHPKYEDFPWTTEFPLERICISELGLKDVKRNDEVIRTAYRDIAAVPFPGVSSDVANTEHPDDVYVKAARTFNRDRPVTPLVIPSAPPS